jgi:hypothetical protein
LWSPSADARCGTLPKRLSEPALTLLLEEVKKGTYDVCNYYTWGDFPGDRECVPNFWGIFFLGMSREETQEDGNLDQARGKGGIGTMRLMSAR